jgi:signal transduction histidine kinase
VTVVAAAVAAERLGGPPWPPALGDLAAGLALIGGGIAAWRQPRDRGPAALMLIAGFMWFAGDVEERLLYAHRGPLVHLLLAYPTARVRPRAIVALVAFAYLEGLVPAIARSDATTIVLFSAVIFAAAWRHRRASGVMRRARATALVASLLVGGTLVIVALVGAVGSGPGVVAAWAFDVAVTVAAVGLAADLRWGGWTRAAVTGLVVELGGRRDPQALRATLARVLGDADLQIAYRFAGDDVWRDETGSPVTRPADNDGRVVTFVRDENREAVAALVHDPAALADPELAASVAAAARLAVANVRMQAEMAEHVLEVTRSRQRLVEAGDDERHELHEELRHGAERRLGEISRRFAALAADDDGAVMGTMRELRAELEGARAELHGFARGIYPRTLTELGLGAALAELAGHGAVPVTLDVPDRRFPGTHEAAAFFVCSEGLANIGKYAAATRARITVVATAQDLLVCVADDGAGGADAARGSGLRGLADRIDALGGALRVHSPPGEGTRLEARLPLPGIAGR